MYNASKVVRVAALSLAVIFPTLGSAEDKTIEIKEYKFEPTQITIPAGTTVTWVNKDDDSHTVTDKGKKFSSKDLDKNDKYSYTYKEPGTYPYFCSLHKSMTGTITVTK